MTQLNISKGKVVYVTYSIKDSKQDFFEVSDVPVSYIQGSDVGLLLALEKALEGKTQGDAVTLSLTPEEAFGLHLEELTFTDALENVPPDYRHLGAEAQFQNEQGEVKSFVVSKVDVEAGTVTLDGNHPLAGQTVTFHVKVMDVREATEEERRTGRPADGLPSLQPQQIH